MRGYTLALSLVAHLAVGIAVYVRPLLAAIEMPVPQHGVAFVSVAATPLPTPPPTPRPVPPATPAPDATAAPIEPPDIITPEPVVPSVPDTALPADGPSFVFGLGTGLPGPEPPPIPAPPARSGPLRIGGVVQPPVKIRDVMPVYPPLARAAAVQGVVILEAVVAATGLVQDVRVLRSIPLLDDAAVAAVRQWRFEPTLLNGEPVPIVMTVTVSFTLR